MSYCVNCGVELEHSLKECPLCNTQVINPNENAELPMNSPFPKEKSTVEAVMRKDVGILVSIILFSTAITCGCLNYFIFNGFGCGFRHYAFAKYKIRIGKCWSIISRFCRNIFF